MNEQELNPGIRETVAFLRSKGFHTTDSGDGVTHDFECDQAYPYVYMRSLPDLLRADAEELLGVLRGEGVEVGQITDDSLGVSIQATYDPVDQTAVLMLTGLDDMKLATARSVAKR